jgi:1-deoxy-D-xylulose-5-phosphate reductoisomerase
LVSNDSRDRVVVLGSTGSIGTQALDVMGRHPDRFEVAGLSAGGGDLDLLVRQATSFNVPVVGVADAGRAGLLQEKLTAAGSKAQVLAGPEASTQLAGIPSDTVLNGITGSVGLKPTLAALESGATLALANKESLVVGGQLVKQAMQRPDQIVPVDSEHSAMAQSLRGGRRSEVTKFILTASGGPFRGCTSEQLTQVTPEQALAHPTWNMGPMVTINSSTLVNKALELIEAHLLFDVPVQDITVVVHPQSVIHSMVEFIDGSTIAQASPPDMRLPIALGLSWPERIENGSVSVDWTQSHAWEFLPLNSAVFPAVDLAREAVQASATHPAVFNAANEECVDAFLAGRIGYLDIVSTVRRVLEDHAAVGGEVMLDDVLAVELWARRRAHEIIDAI